MQIYLPIADLSFNVFYLAALGASVGFLSRLFGVGGGFLLTPLLVFSGIPAPVAVGSVSAQIVAASTPGALANWRRGGIDLHLALYLFLSGVIGAIAGVSTFDALRSAGQLDLVIAASYVVLLGTLGILMLREAVHAALNHRHDTDIHAKLARHHNRIQGLPLRLRFKRSKLYISVLPVLVIGLSVGFVAAMLGTGGGFLLVPALVYILRVPGSVVIGTALLQVLATLAVSTVLHAATSWNVDIVLAFCLMIGGIFGGQFGAAAGRHLKGQYLRALLALLVLAVAIRFAAGLIVSPHEAFTISALPTPRG
ncbi:sulfite exporter TauE/SafE family protein [Rhodobium gokarnense]|uniref:Probable membrane transporter protein n=1 Tax=Rhodobium gokarnense TaxID=364296 RepID=A0ABT3HG72_9HYPH|nr:sulfite exporter TauE/SafE family protein [Rhodobium gokarnense]MCW2309396.1 putative membrane protein YfcA [Rhodobium gokarnense]